MKKTVFVAVVFLAIICLQFPTFAQAPRTLNAAEIKLALNKLGTLCSVLHIAAHPDDENTALLAYFANERLCRTGYLSLTRGEGGQNLIGSEKGAALGVIRTQELLAARRIDGAEQFFTRAIDFGFSKTPEETLAKWNKQQVLSDVVWTIRKFRPDVVITRFPPDARAGHGHHQASAILAAEAFKLAGDKNAFPEQLKYVSVWQPKRLLWNAFVRQNEAPPADALKVDVGTFNPLLGKSYTEIAAESRSMHKSQGFGSGAVRGSRIEYLTHVDGERAAKDVFDGIDTSWKRVESASAIEKLVAQAKSEFDPENSSAIVNLFVRAYKEAKRIFPAAERNFSQTDFRKTADLENIIAACSGLWSETLASDAVVTINGDAQINVLVINRSPLKVQLLDVLGVWKKNQQPISKVLNYNQAFSAQLLFQQINDVAFSQPYWLKKDNNGFLQNVEQIFRGEARNPVSLYAVVKTQIENEPLDFLIPAVYRTVDRVRGEIYQPLAVAPPIVVNLTEPLVVFASNQPKQVRMTIRNNAAATNGVLKLDLPQGWRVEPAQIPIDIREKGAEIAATFTLAPTANAQNGRLTAFVEANGERYDKQQITINYEHIPQQTLFPAAEADLVKLDIKTGKERIGYIVGSGDEIAESLRQIGYDVRLISDEELQTADLSKEFDTIIAGIRAYNTRQVLRKTNQRLLDFVKNGGNFIVQYNTTDETLQPNFAPFPLKIGRERVTVEEAPVRFLQPDAQVLNLPNKITARDFEGFVQERGTYFASEFAPEFKPVLEMHDPNEKEQTGALLVANYGKGKFVYTGIAFFRQLPAGVPGAYRLFANLISREQQK